MQRNTRKLRRNRSQVSDKGVSTPLPKKIRKLARKRKISEKKEIIKDLHDQTAVSGDKKPQKTLKKRKVLRYKKQRCAFIKSDGTQCKNSAVGNGQLCGHHGGTTVIEDNLVAVDSKENMPVKWRKFDPAVHPIQYLDLSRAGMSEVEIAAAFEVAPSTIQRWCETFDSFNTAYEIGKAMHETWWIEKGKDGLDSRSFNTALYKFMTMNKLGYSDKIEQKSLNMNVHGVLLVPDAVTEDQWENEEDILDVTSE